MVGRIVILILAGAAFAHAAPRADVKREARAHFVQGEALQRAGAYDDAIQEYQAAYKLAPLPPLLFNIAQAHRLKNDKPAALEWYRKYLAADPDGPLADEAQNHIASLELKLQVEAAETARRQAAEEAAEARRQAQAAESARQKAVEEEAARKKSATDEAARLRKLDEVMAEANRQKHAAEAEDQRRRLAQAEKKGLGLRIAGGLAIGAGLVFGAGLSWWPIADNGDHKQSLEHTTGMWTENDDAQVQQLKTDSHTLIALVATGGALIVVGTVLAIVGVRQKANAIERAKAPAVSLGPTGVRF